MSSVLPSFLDLTTTPYKFIIINHDSTVTSPGLIGLIAYLYHQVAISFPEAHLQRTPGLSVFGPEQISGWVTDREVFPGAQSEDKSAQKRLGLVCRAML
jgi:hypothetical protein